MESSSYLIHLFDCRSCHNFLVDTGAERSVLPHQTTRPPHGPHLVSTGGTVISAWGTQRSTVDFGGRQFTFPFVLATVPHPILVADFLAHHRLLVDLHNHQVLQSSTLEPLPTSATAAPLLLPFVAQLQTMPPPIRTLIAEFPTVFNSALQSARPDHGVQHHIQTTGPPVFAKVRRRRRMAPHCQGRI